MYNVYNFILSAGPAAGEMLRTPGWAVSWERALAVWFDFIVSYGWRVVVFTLLLKLMLFPLDFYQRYVTRKNQKIQERIAPDVEKIKKMYPDRQMQFSKQRQLQKREGLKPFGACLPAIVTMLIFLSLWQAMLNVGQFMTVQTYFNLHDTFIEVQTESHARAIERGDTPTQAETYARTQARAAVRERYENHERQSFLWISNVWVPDVPWQRPIFRDAPSFFSSIDRFYRGNHRQLSESNIRGTFNYELFLYERGEELDENGRMTPAQIHDFNQWIHGVMGQYEDVMHDLIHAPNNRNNGFLLMVILAVALNFGTQFLTMKQQKKAGMSNPMGMDGAMGGMMGGGNMMKIMMFVFPIMMGIFAISMAAAFTIYMVMNATLTMLGLLSMMGIFKLMDKRRESKMVTQVQKYGRPDPNSKNKKDK